AHYFYAESDQVVLDVPVGAVTITVVRGFRNHAETRSVKVPAEGADERFEVRALASLDEAGGPWVSADLHVHRNYGGTYKNQGDRRERQCQGEHLDLLNNLVVNKEQRFPDLRHDRVPGEGGSHESRIIDGQEFHTSYWGHRGILNLKDHL